MLKGLRKRSPWMEGLIFAEELVQQYGNTREVSKDLNNPFDFSEFDRGALDYCRYFNLTLKEVSNA